MIFLILFIGMGCSEPEQDAKVIPMVEVDNEVTSEIHGPDDTESDHNVSVTDGVENIEAENVEAESTETEDVEAGNNKVKSDEIIKISIKGTEDHGVILEMCSCPWEENITVLGVLVGVAREQGIQMEYSGVAAGAYVEGIDNLYEFDYGAKSGWMYRVNGEIPQMSAGAYHLSPGDTIEWMYTEDLGRDLGSESFGGE
jgi:hypothetical protein